MQLQGLRFRNWSPLGLKGAVSLDAQVRGSHLNLKRQPNFAFPIWRRQSIASLENQVKPLIVSI